MTYMYMHEHIYSYFYKPYFKFGLADVKIIKTTMYKLVFILLHVWTQEENFIVRTKVAKVLYGTLRQIFRCRTMESDHLSATELMSLNSIYDWPKLLTSICV